MKEPWNLWLYQSQGRMRLIGAMMHSYERSGMLIKPSGEFNERLHQSMVKFLMEIPVHTLIYMPIEQDPIRYEEEYAAVSAFIQNAQLAAWAEGVGVLWTITPYMHDPLFMAEIGLDGEKYKIVAVLQMGYPKQTTRDKGRTPISEKMRWIKD